MFSAVSKLILATKCSFCSICQALHNDTSVISRCLHFLSLSVATFRFLEFSKNAGNCLNFAEIIVNVFVSEWSRKRRLNWKDSTQIQFGILQKSAVSKRYYYSNLMLLQMCRNIAEKLRILAAIFCRKFIKKFIKSQSVLSQSFWVINQRLMPTQRLSEPS